MGGSPELQDAELVEPVTIRLAKLGDMDQLMEMWAASVEEIRPVDAVAATVDLSKVVERIEFFEWLIQSGDAGVAVAEIEGSRLVGMLTFQECTNPGFFKVLHYAFISSVHVRPEDRRRGIAQHITETALGWLRQRGVEEVQLANSPWNEAAEHTWEKLGFEVILVNRRRVL